MNNLSAGQFVVLAGSRIRFRDREEQREITVTLAEDVTVQATKNQTVYLEDEEDGKEIGDGSEN